MRFVRCICGWYPQKTAFPESFCSNTGGVHLKTTCPVTGDSFTAYQPDLSFDAGEWV